MDMDHQSVDALRRLTRLEHFGRQHFATGIRTNNAARIVRVVRFLDAINARARALAISRADEKYRN